MSDNHTPNLSQTLDLGLREGGPHSVEWEGKRYNLDHIVEHLCYGYCPERQSANDEIEEMLSGFADGGPEYSHIKDADPPKLP